jgi:hypothetical protein
MNVFLALRVHETEVLGVFATLEEALAIRPDEVDEYIVGHETRLRSYGADGKVWWENGRHV